MKYFCTTIEEK